MVWGYLCLMRPVRHLCVLATLSFPLIAASDARVVHMQPMAVDLEGARTELSFPRKYGADTRQVLAEAGYSGADIDALAGYGVIA